MATKTTPTINGGYYTGSYTTKPVSDPMFRMVHIQVRIEQFMKDDLKQKAKDIGISYPDLVRDLIYSGYLDRFCSTESI